VLDDVIGDFSLAANLSSAGVDPAIVGRSFGTAEGADCGRDHRNDLFEQAATPDLGLECARLRTDLFDLHGFSPPIADARRPQRSNNAQQ
jgi:hypothetical protein